MSPGIPDELYCHRCPGVMRVMYQKTVGSVVYLYDAAWHLLDVRAFKRDRV